MKIDINGKTAFEKKFETPDEFIHAMYVEGPTELTANTRFALEAMVLAGVLFFIGQAIALYYRQSASKAAAKRHEEILKKLGELQRHPTTEKLQDLLAELPPGVTVSTGNEDALLIQQTVAKLASDVPSLSVVGGDPTAGQSEPVSLRRSDAEQGRQP